MVDERGPDHRNAGDLRPSSTLGADHARSHDHDPRHDHHHEQGENHAHDHGQQHDAHSPGHEHSHVHGLSGHGSANERRTFWAALITLAFMVLELVGGIVSGSLALIADSAHMLTDSVSLAFAWFAFRLARRPADNQRSYGFDRMQIVAAYTNGVAMLAVVAWIFFEAASRLMSPEFVEAETMLWIAVAGLGANIIAFFILHGADRDNLNIRGAILHVIGDLLGSVAAIIAALVILWTGWMPIDPLLSGVVGLLLLASAVRLVKEAGHILLEGAPRHLSSHLIAKDIMQNVPGIADVHHVHIWSLTSERPLLTMHARVSADTSAETAIKAIKARLTNQFGIDHATVEIEWASCNDDHNACYATSPGA